MCVAGGEATGTKQSKANSAGVECSLLYYKKINFIMVTKNPVWERSSI